MNTIEIVKELNSVDATNYRAVLGTKWRGEAAVHGDQQAVGMTPGQALDALENLMAEDRTSEERMLIIVQRFRPDTFFNSNQQLRLRELMAEFHTAVQEGKELPAEKMAELELLVEEEYQGAFARTEATLKEARK